MKVVFSVFIVLKKIKVTHSFFNDDVNVDVDFSIRMVVIVFVIVIVA